MTGVSGFDLATVDKLLTTTRAVRKRLDLTRPVELDVIMECLRLAIQAPTGSNMQTWRWIVVTDPEMRTRLADLYPKGNPSGAVAPVPQQERVMDSVRHLMKHLHEVPVRVVPCVEGQRGPA